MHTYPVHMLLVPIELIRKDVLMRSKIDYTSPEVILGSDILTLTPAKIMAQTYRIDGNKWKKAITPVKPSTFIGPPLNSSKAAVNISYEEPPYIDQYADQMYPYTHQSRPNFHLGK